MVEIISSKKASHGTELMYRLRSSVDSIFLEKMNELGVRSLTKFHRFDRLAHPQFKIKNVELGVEVRGKIGENFL